MLQPHAIAQDITSKEERQKRVGHKPIKIITPTINNTHKMFLDLAFLL